MLVDGNHEPVLLTYDLEVDIILGCPNWWTSAISRLHTPQNNKQWGLHEPRVPPVGYNHRSSSVIHHVFYLLVGKKLSLDFRPIKVVFGSHRILNCSNNCQKETFQKRRNNANQNRTEWHALAWLLINSSNGCRSHHKDIEKYYIIAHLLSMFINFWQYTNGIC